MSSTNIPSSPHPAVEDAFKKFQQLIHPSDDRMFKQTTLEDVRKAASVISRDQSQRNCLRNLNRIKPLFDLLNKLSGPIEALCQGTPYLCYIWAPIKLMLQIADEYSNSFDKLVDAYVQISQHLPRVDRLSEAFSSHTDFQSVLADIYSDILEFHSHAYSFLRRGGWKALFDASWRSFGSRFNAILRRLEKGRDLLDREAASFEILESKDFRQKLLEDLERRELERRDLQMRDTLLWLDLKGQDREQEELIERRNTTRQPSTCTWILNHSKISSWLDIEDSRPFLWLSGKPGSGKTTLAIYLIEHATFSPKSVVLYCLCSYGFGRSESNACSLMLRSLIAQIVRSRKDLLPYVYDNYVKIGMAASLPKTRMILRDLLRTSELTFLIIDGVDECESEHQKQILGELFGITSQGEENATVKVLICSRETSETTRKLGKVPKLSLNDVKENIEKDITTFTMQSLTELYDQFDREIVAGIGKEIVRKSSVLASLLEQGSVQDMQKTISRLPADLPGVYKSILDSIHKTSDEHLSRRLRIVLGLLSSSCRPLKLWEVCDFITFHEGADVLSDKNKLTKNALNFCKPFVEELDDETVRIIHFSAREFLFETISGPYLQQMDVDSDITSACVRYLLTCRLFTDRVLDSRVYIDTICGLHDLLPYVCEFWSVHLRRALLDSPEKSLQLVPKDNLLLLLRQLAVFMQRYNSDSGADTHRHFVESSSDNDHLESDSETLRLPALVDQYLEFRSKVFQKQQHVVTDLDDPADSLLSDPTLLSEIHDNFVKVFEQLLSESIPPEIVSMVQPAQIVDFMSRHSNAAFFCRWSGCIWASSGFKSLKERAQHEDSHKKRFRCPHSGCDSALQGFTSKQALRKHKERYHTTIDNILLPSFPLSTTTKPLDQNVGLDLAPIQNSSNRTIQLAQLALRTGTWIGWQTMVLDEERIDMIIEMATTLCTISSEEEFLSHLEAASENEFRIFNRSSTKENYIRSCSQMIEFYVAPSPQDSTNILNHELSLDDSSTGLNGSTDRPPSRNISHTQVMGDETAKSLYGYVPFEPFGTDLPDFMTHGPAPGQPLLGEQDTHNLDLFLNGFDAGRDQSKNSSMQQF